MSIMQEQEQVSEVTCLTVEEQKTKGKGDQRKQHQTYATAAGTPAQPQKQSQQQQTQPKGGKSNSKQGQGKPQGTQQPRPPTNLPRSPIAQKCLFCVDPTAESGQKHIHLWPMTCPDLKDTALWPKDKIKRLLSKHNACTNCYGPCKPDQCAAPATIHCREPGCGKRHARVLHSFFSGSSGSAHSTGGATSA